MSLAARILEWIGEEGEEMPYHAGWDYSQPLGHTNNWSEYDTMIDSLRERSPEIEPPPGDPSPPFLYNPHLLYSVTGQWSGISDTHRAGEGKRDLHTSPQPIIAGWDKVTYQTEGEMSFTIEQMLSDEYTTTDLEDDVESVLESNSYQPINGELLVRRDLSDDETALGLSEAKYRLKCTAPNGPTGVPKRVLFIWKEITTHEKVTDDAKQSESTDPEKAPPVANPVAVLKYEWVENVLHNQVAETQEHVLKAPDKDGEIKVQPLNISGFLSGPSILKVNSDDDDSDLKADNDEGTIAPQEDDIRRLQISAQLDLSGSGTVNAQLTATGAGKVRLWERSRKDGSFKSIPLPYTLPGKDKAGSMSDSDGYYVEAIQPGNILLSLETTGTVATTLHVLEIKAFDVDLDTDSDNTGTVDRSPEEEGRQIRRVGDPVDPKHAGKILMANTADVDGDGVPDWADGIDDVPGFGAGVGIVPTSGPESARFAQIKVEPQNGGGSEKVWVKFTYNGSDPYELSTQAAAEESGKNSYAHGNGSCRLWKKDGDERRSAQSVTTPGGDYIPSGMQIRADQLAGDTIYLEALKATPEIGGISVVCQVALGNTSGPTSPWFTGDRLSFTALDLGLTSLDGSSSPGSGGVDLSHSSPVIKVDSQTVSAPYYSENSDDGAGWFVDITVAGTVKSDLCDTVPGDKGKIKDLRVYINGDRELLGEAEGGQPAPEPETPFTTLTLSVSKTRDTSNLAKPYPYLGTFNSVITGVPAMDGNNTVSLRACDPIYKLDSEAVSAWEAELCATTIKAGRRRQLKLPSWEGGFSG